MRRSVACFRRPTIVRSSRSRRPQRSGRVLSWIAVLSVAGILLTFGLWLVGDRLLPGTYVTGLGLGNLGSKRAEIALADAWSRRPIVLRADGDSWPATPAELGLVLDARATIAAARDAGRTPAALFNTLLRRQILDVPPVWHSNTEAARAFVAQLAPQVAVAPASAGIHVAGGIVSTSPARDGRALDEAATLLSLQANAANVVAQQELQLATRSVPAQVRDVSSAVAAAEALLAQPLTLEGWDPVRDERFTWQVPAEEWGAWLLLADLAPDGTQPTWTVDVSGLGGGWTARAWPWVPIGSSSPRRPRQRHETR